MSCGLGLLALGEPGESPVEEGPRIEAATAQKDGWQNAAPGKVDQVAAADGNPRQNLIRCFVNLAADVPGGIR